MSTAETKQKGTLRHLGPIIRKYWARYLLGILILAVVDISQTIIPSITAGVIDQLSSFTATARTLLVALLQIGGLVAGMTVGRYFWRFLIWGSARYVEQEVRGDLFAKYLELSADFHDVHKTGDLMALVTNDLEAVRQGLIEPHCLALVLELGIWVQRQRIDQGRDDCRIIARGDAERVSRLIDQPRAFERKLDMAGLLGRSAPDDGDIFGKSRR